MAQQGWNITGARGQTFKLGLFHGQDTGHVVVHCNERVVAVDFGVKEAKTYSVFLDQELCEISIEPQPDQGFAYDCRINTEVKTELNERRRRGRAEQRQLEVVQLVCGGLVCLVLLLMLIF